jgi:hypothetical protein
MLVGILLNEQEVLASDELAKIKIPLGTFGMCCQCACCALY